MRKMSNPALMDVITPSLHSMPHKFSRLKKNIPDTNLLQNALGNKAAAQLLSEDANQHKSDVSTFIHTAAVAGTQGVAKQLPHFDKIQAAFGKHDISHLQAYTGTQARQASKSMNAKAYATGNKVAFADSNPDLFTASHEAAHSIQQQGGVQLKSNIGEKNDRYEQHADAVAHAVTQGKNAEQLLNAYASSSNHLKVNAHAPVQRMLLINGSEIKPAFFNLWLDQHTNDPLVKNILRSWKNDKKPHDYKNFSAAVKAAENQRDALMKELYEQNKTRMIQSTLPEKEPKKKTDLNQSFVSTKSTTVSQDNSKKMRPFTPYKTKTSHADSAFNDDLNTSTQIKKIMPRQLSPIKRDTKKPLNTQPFKTQADDHLDFSNKLDQSFQLGTRDTNLDNYLKTEANENPQYLQPKKTFVRKKYLKKTNPVSSTLVGNIPGRGITTFEEETVPGNGDCGFNTLGVSRDDLVNTLLPLMETTENRAFLQEEVLAAFMTGELKINNPQATQLIRNRQRAQANLDETFRQIRDQFPEAGEQPIEDTLQWLVENGHTQAFINLYEAYTNSNDIEHELKIYLQDPKIVQIYLESLRDNLWLGYKSALLYARQTNMGLYIWRRRSPTSPQLVLMYSYLPENGGNGQVIHMLHTQGFTHFNLLVERGNADLSRMLINQPPQNLNKIKLRPQTPSKMLKKPAGTDAKKLIINNFMQEDDSKEERKQQSPIRDKQSPDLAQQIQISGDKKPKSITIALIKTLTQILSQLSEPVDISKHLNFLSNLNPEVIRALTSPYEKAVKQLKILREGDNNNLPFFEPSLQDKTKKYYQEENILNWYNTLQEVATIVQRLLSNASITNKTSLKKELLRIFKLFGNKSHVCNKGNLGWLLAAYGYLMTLEGNLTSSEGSKTIKMDKEAEEAMNDTQQLYETDMAAAILKKIELQMEIQKIIQQFNKSEDIINWQEKEKSYFLHLAKIMQNNKMKLRDNTDQREALEELRKNEQIKYDLKKPKKSIIAQKEETKPSVVEIEPIDVYVDPRQDLLSNMLTYVDQNSETALVIKQLNTNKKLTLMDKLKSIAAHLGGRIEIMAASTRIATIGDDTLPLVMTIYYENAQQFENEKKKK